MVPFTTADNAPSPDAYFILHFNALYLFPQLTYFDLFWCHRRIFWCFALTLITQLFDPSCHCGKANIHSFGGICHCVVLVNNPLSGFAFKLCAEISFFHWSTCVALR